MASKEVAKKAAQEMTMFSDAPQVQGSGRGSEGVSTSDLIIPRIEIIQDLSPQRKKSEPEYIEGAEEGQMFNTVTKELYTDGIIIVPVMFRKEYIIWKNRKKGGGFNGSFETMELAEAALSQLDNPIDPKDGPLYAIQDTHQNFCLIVRPESTVDNPVVDEAVLSFSKSKMKVGRQLNSIIKMRGGDRWSSAYRLEVIADSNKSGDNFFNYKVTPVGYVSPAVAALAEQMYEDVKSFRKDVSREPAGTVVEEEETTY
jgi:hypothetical protein